MSRYTISPRKDDSLEIVVGWDAPLNTLFAHVIRPTLEDDDEFLLMVGDRLDEIKRVYDLANLVSPWADIPYDVKSALAKDMEEPYKRSALQNWMIDKGLVR